MFEKIINDIGHFIQLSFGSVLSIIKVIIRSKSRFKIPHAQQSACYILGNGPSLNISIEKYHNLLRNAELFVVNSFSVSAYFKELQPANYIFLDQYFTQYDGKQTPIEAVKKTFDQLITEVNWPMIIFMPAITSNNPFHKELIKNPNINIVYYNYVVANGFKRLNHWLFSHNLAMPQCQNIISACIFLAINRKFKNVYLLGADHSWHEQLTIDNTNDVVITDKHFYNEKGKEITMKTRVHNAVEYGVHTFFQSISKAFYSYHVLKEYAISQGVNIYNASEKSYIDAFERKSISE